MGAWFFKSLFDSGEGIRGENTDRAELVSPAELRKERVAIRGRACYNLCCHKYFYYGVTSFLLSEWVSGESVIRIR